MAFANKAPGVEMLTPIVQELMRRGAPAQVKSFEIFADHDHRFDRRQVMLVVRHLIRDIGPGYIEDTGFPEMVERIHRALLIREPSVKARKVERRLMLARGAQARQTKARRR